MNHAAIRALIKNDLRLYRTDRRAIIVGVLVPILIAAFFGYVFGGNGRSETTGKIPVGIVDEDAGAISMAIVADLNKESLLDVQMLSRTEAQKQVQTGKLQVAAVIPKNFGSTATRALFTNDLKPKVELLIDPSQSMSSRVVQGLLAQYGMQEITREAFSGPTGSAALSDTIQRLDRSTATDVPARAELRALLEAAQKLNLRNASGSAGTSGAAPRGLSMPYEIATVPVTSTHDVPYNGYAHSFAGMTTQFLLFAGIDAGIVLLLARQAGIWQRLRSAPLRKSEFLLARTFATTLISLFQFTLVYLVAMAVFGVRVQGSWLGFILMAVSLCLLNASFGLMLASIGRSAAATRAIAMLVTILLVMIGGAWVPSFIFPSWLQQASLATPTRWAVDGLDAMTWRGLGFAAAAMPILVLTASASVCLAISIWRFRWEE